LPGQGRSKTSPDVGRPIFAAFVAGDHMMSKKPSKNSTSVLCRTDAHRFGSKALVSGAALVVAMAVSASGAQAQDQPTANSGAPAAASTAPTAAAGAGIIVEDVVITARLREEKLEDIPIPATAVSAAKLEREHLTTVKDFTEQAPDLTVNSPNARQTSIAIRGVGKNTANEALEASVGVIVDGVFISTVGMSWADFSDIDHIEIVRGPQGTLLGKNTTLGVLSITSKAPSFTPEKELEVTYGNRNLFVTKGSATGPLIDNTLAYRASVYFDHQDGFLTNNQAGGDSYDGASNRWGGRLQFLFTPNADVTNRTIIDHGQSDERVNVNFAVSDPQTYSNNGASRGTTYSTRLARFSYVPILGSWSAVDLNSQHPIKTQQNGISSQTDWRINDFTVTSISAYRDFHFDALNDSDLTPLNIATGGTLVDARQYSQELRLTSPANQDILGQKFDYTLGLYALRSEINTTSRTIYGTDAGKFYASNAQLASLSAQALSDSLNGVFLRSAEHPDTTSLAAYAQTTWHATDKADLTLGARNTYEDKTNWAQEWATGGVAATGTALTLRNSILKLYQQGGVPIQGQTIYADSWSWLVNPSYKITEDILGYFSISSGEKSGAVQFNQAVVPGTNFLYGTPLNVLPEQTLDYELGVKSAWLDRKLIVNVNLFDTEIKNYQAQLSTVLPGATTATSYLGNVPGVRMRGVEVEGFYITPIEGLRFTYSGSFNDAIYSNFKNAPCAPDLSYSTTQVCDFTGKQLSGASRFIVNGGFDYATHLVPGYTSHFFASETYRSRANLNTSLSVYGWQDGYFLTNAGISFGPDNGSWDLALWGKNITNTHYYTNIASLSPSAPVAGTPGDPLTVGATFHTKW
jgi:iron complex outermembrane receptor protein